MNPVRVLIADDEPLARERIRTLLSRFTQATIVGEARDGNETLEMIRDLRPSLVFLDVQMPEMDGFAVLEKLDSTSVPAVIFVTAYDAFALRAFEVHAIDYLLKPFTRARFTRAMEHSLRRLGQANGTPGIKPGLFSLLESIRSDPKPHPPIPIPPPQCIYFVPLPQ